MTLICQFPETDWIGAAHPASNIGDINNFIQVIIFCTL